MKRKFGMRMWLSGGWLVFLIAVTLMAPILSPHDPLAQDLFASRLPPFWMDGA
ncbi:MAG: ABC transporter permease, partial [Rhodospirillaceae bacterium]|nr:ABC transporter permease [Rhodospirillaceae bacterium]